MPNFCQLVTPKLKNTNIFFKSGHFYAKIYLILYIVSFQFLPTSRTGVPGPQQSVSHETLDLQNQREKSEENVKNNETSKGSGTKKSASGYQRFDIGQIKILEGYFQQGLTNPNEDSRNILAEELKVDVHRVFVWFRNRRPKVKNQQQDLRAREALHAVDFQRDASSPEVIYVSNRPTLNNLITYQENLRSKGNSIPCPQAVQLQRAHVQTVVRGFNPTLPAAENRLSVQNKK